MVVKELKNRNSSLKRIVNNKYRIQFLPEQISFLSKEKFIYFNGRKLKSDYCIDIIHTLLLKYFFKKENQFPLSSLILKDKYGYNYNYYINYLIHEGHISLIKNYMKGKNSRVYKLNNELLNSNIIKYKNTDKFLLKKYIKQKEHLESNSELILDEIKIKLLDDLNYVDIQYEKAIFFLDSSLQEKSIYNKNKYSVDCIKDDHIFYHFDKYGRLHTNFTILKSFIRKNCLLIGGEETAEVDIKNSQPLFLYKVISNYTSLIDEKELELFKYLTINGIFYQYIIDNSNINNKKTAKKVVYKVLFGKNYNNKSDRLFSKLFPSIYDFIKLYKKENGSYKVLSHELQKLESNLIFNKIIKEINNTDPDIRLITIHDSIMFQKKHQNIIEYIFYKNIKNEFNIQ